MSYPARGIPFRTRGILSAVLALALLLPVPTAAERLPIKAYTTADGLAHNAVHKIVRHSRGFLWFATDDGLSRFDGYTFANYSVEHGLPHRTVMDLIETRQGELWVATLGGLVRFNPRGVPSNRAIPVNDADATPPMFASIVPADPDPRARAVHSVFEARDGTIWCGTRKGLYRLRRSGPRYELLAVDLAMPDTYTLARQVNDLLEDRYGTIWAATPFGLYRRWPDGSHARYAQGEGLPDEHFHALFSDRQDRLWVGSRNTGFYHLTFDGSRAAPVVAERYNYPELPAVWINALAETSDGTFWVATASGLAELVPNGNGQRPRVRGHARRGGLSHFGLTALGVDSGGNVWMGTSTSGVMKLARNGFVTYDDADGVSSVSDVFGDSTGVYFRGDVLGDQRASAFDGKAVDLDQREPGIRTRFGSFDGRRFEWFTPHIPFSFGWFAERNVQRRGREWWIGGEHGVYRYPPMSTFSQIRSVSPAARYTSRNGLIGPYVYRMFADSRGDVWISVQHPSRSGLMRWDSQTGTLRDVSAALHAPELEGELPRAFGEDRHGAIWVGFNNGIARYRDGTFTVFVDQAGVPISAIRHIHSDRAGRLWLASARSGLIRVNEIAADRPVFTAFTIEQGLSSNNLSVIGEDLYGRLYVGTGRGLDRLSPETGRIRHFTTDDGLASGSILAIFRDLSGTIWIGTHGGLSRFAPEAPEPSAAPPILITRLTVSGQRQPISASGETDVSLSDLSTNRNQLDIDFVGLGFETGERLRYQYRVDGSDGDWSTPSEQRTINLASLSPGRYRFLARAVNVDGIASASPAAVSFTILPPVWRRGWFLSVAALAIGLTLAALHRARVSRVLELERVRTRIAADLHDDIGANLTRIAILSEVARQPQRTGDTPLDAPLSSISRIARESVASMSDLVWAIAPNRDTLGDVVRRMRSHAEEVFESRDVALTLDLPATDQSMTLGVNVRRDLYLVFKEAVNNTARHSSCRCVTIVFRVAGPALVLSITDDGIGFDVGSDSHGQGLANMRRRAERLGAILDVRSRHGAGTTVALTMPAAEPARTA